MTSEIRPYADSDFDSVTRFWQEIRWLDDKESEKESLKRGLAAGTASVGVVDGSAEALSLWVPGSIRYINEDARLCLIAAITTSPLARRHKFASRLTALALAEGAAAGDEVAALGIFDQGFYDRLGFGTGGYDHRVTFDPALLDVEVPEEQPVRLGPDDYVEIHSLMARRLRPHGGVVLDPPETLWSELSDDEKGYGLGFRDDGRLTHYIYLTPPTDGGPWRVRWYGYETADQLVRLLGLMKSLSDQVVSISIIEPQQLQLQDFIRRPLRDRTRTNASKHAHAIDAIAWWQVRMLDVEACLNRVNWRGGPLTVNLEVSDPAGEFLEGEWKGVGGTYVASFGEAVTVERGSDNSVETVQCTVNALTRWWLGIATASNLSLTGKLTASATTLGKLDDGLRLPTPVTGWAF